VEIEGKRILLSGATGGIGAAIAARLAEKGARLVLSSRRQAELRELARSLPGGARRHKVVVADLSKEGAPEKLVRDAGKAGGLDRLVANAALPASGRLESYSRDQMVRAVRVNLEAPIRMTHELLPALLEKGDGHMVFISSLNGLFAPPRTSLYSATKFGLRGFAQALREDLHGTGVGVSVVSPGFVRDAGLFADSGGSTGGMGTTSPQRVGKAVDRAIRRNRSEIEVAPFRQRRLNRFAAHHPDLAARVSRGRSHAIADQIADGQAAKR
jgi:short-subunit dehydrogenase